MSQKCAHCGQALPEAGVEAVRIYRRGADAVIEHVGALWPLSTARLWTAGKPSGTHLRTVVSLKLGWVAHVLARKPVQKDRQVAWVETIPLRSLPQALRPAA